MASASADAFPWPRTPFYPLSRGFLFYHYLLFRGNRPLAGCRLLIAYRYSAYFRTMAHVDVISDILSAALKAYPDSEFVQGLSHQYLVKGGLSKRQMEGLYKKAERIKTIPPGKLATLEAIILKKHKKYRSDLPTAPAPIEKDEKSGEMIAAILQNYPQHKRVLFLAAKHKAAEPLSSTEAAELNKFYKLLVKQSS